MRDSERYGIVFIVTAVATNSVQSKVSSNFSNIYTLKLKDLSDYSSVLGIRVKSYPREIFGRGILYLDDVHEFQTASIVGDMSVLNESLIGFIEKQIEINKVSAKKIPILPEVVRYNDISNKISNLRSVPIGISNKDLDIVTMDYLSNLGNIITTTKLENSINLVKSLLFNLKTILNSNLIVIDAFNELNLKGEYNNYFTDNFESVLVKINDYVDRIISNNLDSNGVILIYGFSKYLNKINDSQKIVDFIKNIKKCEKISLIIVDDYNKIKGYMYESWFTSIFSLNNGIWIGRGITDQSLLRLTSVTKEMTKDYKNDMGYLIEEGLASLCKFIDFVSDEREE